MTTDRPFARLVSLACHDLRTPLAAVGGFARTLDGPESWLIAAAVAEMTDMLELLGLAARIESGRYEPALVEADMLELARSGDERIAVEGAGATVQTDPGAVRSSLGALARAALIHGGARSVTWRLDGRELTLSPVNDEARPVVTGESPRDLGALVARLAIESLGGSLAVDGDSLRVRL